MGHDDEAATHWSLEFAHGDTRPLFQGESVRLFVVIEDTKTSQASERWQHLVQRWRARYDGTIVDLRIVVQESPSVKSKVFHQEATMVWEHIARFRIEFVIKVRPEYFDRSLQLSVRILHPLMPTSISSSAERVLTERTMHQEILQPLTTATSDRSALVRHLRTAIVVTKPLEIRMETRWLRPGRLCVMAKATNTSLSLMSIEILDLQFHLNETHSHPDETTADQFELDHDANQAQQQQFPVTLEAREQHNFFFIVHVVNHCGDGASRQTLLTLSWKPKDHVVAASITEHHLVIWSPTPSSIDATTTIQRNGEKEEHEWLFQAMVASPDLASIIPNYPSVPLASIPCVRLDQSGVLRIQLAPVQEEQTPTLCLFITNCSLTQSVDLTLLLLPSAGSWIGLEATHRIGLIAPGTTARKSVHVMRVTQSDGHCQWRDHFVWFDSLSQTFFREHETLDVRCVGTC